MRFIITIIMTACIFKGYAQSNDDDRQVVGVAEFSCNENSPYTGLVTEKVVEMLTNSKRFRVVDRTSREKITQELELQKSEAFIDSENLVEQDVAVAAEKMITGEIVKIPVYRMKNRDGSVRGYKASVAFQMKIVDVATGLSTEATSFEGKASDECLSPESAVTMAMMSLQDKMAEYFRINFPITAKLMKIEKEKNGVAEIILIKAGKKHGIKVGDKFNVEVLEILDGEILPTTLGIATVMELKGEAYAECKVSKKEGKAIYENFNANKQIKSYKDMDIEGIKNSAAEWEKKYKDETAELNNKLTQQERDFATNSYFAGMNFTSESAKRGIISQFKEQNFELKDGKFIGADEYINGLKESDAGAFVVEKTKDEPSLPTFTKGTASKGAPGGENNANAFGFHFAGVRAMPKE